MEEMSANPALNANIEMDKEGGRQERGEKRKNPILVSSDEDKKTSKKGSQERKKRRMSSNLKMDQVDEAQKTCAKKRKRTTNSSDQKEPMPKMAKDDQKIEDLQDSQKKEDQHDDQKKEDQHDDHRDPEDSGVRPTCSRSTISENIRERLIFHHVLGQGNFGKVIMAEDSSNHQKYAVKIISKRSVLNSDDEACVMVERRVFQLASGSPFLVHTDFAFQTKKLVLLGLEYMSCGDFYDFLQMKGRLDIPSATFYAAELVCGIQFLHSNGIVHRDLKPENILVADTGHIKITDFGLAVENMFGDRTATKFAGTKIYMAPEMLAGEEYNAGVDWYSFGVILNKMVTSKLTYSPALFDNNQSIAQDIIKELICRDPAKRLGVKRNIRGHHFFQNIDWVSVEALRMPPPHIPVPTEPHYCPITFKLDNMEAIEARMSSIPQEKQAIFRGFSFVS